MRQLILVVAAAAALSGCDRMQAAFTPIPEKINAAFPLPDEVEVARSRLFTALEADPSAHEAAGKQFAQLMTARGLTCTAATPVGRLDTPAMIRARGTDEQCFTTQDAQLDEWIGIRRMALVLRAAPLVPITDLPAQVPLPNTTESIASVHLAAAANVLVLRTHQQKIQALQVPSVREIASFTVPEPYGRVPSLSPNGRLLAAPGPKVLRFMEVQSGKVLWTTDKYQDVIAWEPRWDMVVLTQAGTTAPHTLDTRTGKVERYPATDKRLMWALSTREGRLLVGTQSSASLMQHGRTASGALEVHAVQQWSLTNGSYGSAPFLVNGGKRLVYVGRDLSWLDLATGQQGSWQLSALGGSNFAQAGDSLITFDSMVQGEPGLKPRVFDTEKMTVANLKGFSGQAFPLPPRFAFVKRGPNATALVGTVEAEDPQDLERVISDVMVARELAKLQDPLRPDFRTEPPARGERPVPSAGTPVAAAARPVVGKTMLDVPPDSRIAIVGVYQAARSPNSTARTDISVNVAPGSTPLVLVLSSYESVNWMLRPNGRKIAAILVSGYSPSNVYGHGNTPVVRIGSRYAYKIDSPQLTELRRDVARYVGGATPVFQGTYEGQEFQVN